MQNLTEILKWYVDMGIDETISDESNKINKPTEDFKLEQNTIFAKSDNVIINYRDIENLSRQLADKAQTLEQLFETIKNFNHLDICKTATNTVLFDGQKDSQIMLIGEAPGENEDLKAIPFCGVSGKLLDTIFARFGLTRAKNLYITNSVFWRPPGNRKPTLHESKVCLPFVEKHIAFIKPKLIIMVGSTSACHLLNRNESMQNLRKKFISYSNQYLDQPIPTATIFHPAFLLRQPSKKKDMWFDMLEINRNYQELFSQICA